MRKSGASFSSPEFQEVMAETVSVNIFHVKFSLTMLEAFVSPEQAARIGNLQVAWLRWESTCACLSPGAEWLLGGGREWVRMKKQMLSRLEFSFMLFGRLAATETLWQHVFSWERCHKISCDKCNTWFPTERADVGYFCVDSVAVVDFLFFFFWKYL